MLDHRIDALDLDAAKADVIRFVRDPDAVSLWTKAFFHDVAAQVSVA
jgi:hypothetical protein